MGANGAPPAPGPGPAPAPPSPPPGPAPDQKDEPEAPFVVELPASSEWLRVGLTNRGGAIRYVTLRHSFELPNRRHHLDLILPSDRDLLTGMLSFADDKDVERMRTLGWTRDAAAEARTDEVDVVFTFDTTRGFRVAKRFVFPTQPDRFDCDVEVSATLLPGATPPADGVELRLLGVAGAVAEPRDYVTGLDPPPTMVSYVVGSDTEPSYPEWRIPADPNSAAVNLTPQQYAARSFRIAGVRTQYFAVAMFASPDATSPRVKRFAGGGNPRPQGDQPRKDLGDALVRFYEGERARPLAGDLALTAWIGAATFRWLQAWADFDLKPAAAGETPEKAVFHLYVGPTSRRAFGQDRYEPLRAMITYPFSFDFLAKGLLAIFDFFHGLLGSAGIAVILMTLVVRGLMMPLSVRNQLSMRRYGKKVAKLKPEIERLKKKWPNDRKRLQEEQMKLYREHGIGFPTGCLMLLLQIPIFMALFSSLRIDFDLRHESFFWIRDLAGPDRLLDFGTDLMPIGFPVGGLYSLNLLPLLSVVLSIWQQKQMPKPTDEQQAQQMKMMKWMPIFFAVLLYNYTAALSLYMIFSSGVAILESKWVKHHDALEAAK
jgi:YidC/Oxa1 family membrane protein insertase